MGGDDYLSKPFSYTELLSRVKALIRRYHVYNQSSSSQDPCIHIQNLSIDTDTHQILRDDEEIFLTDIEYQIFHLLATNRNKIFSVQNIYESVWNEPYFSTSNNTVTVHIRNIRKKLEPDVQNPRYIQNVWGRGYRIV
ncbi:MAG: response regulator transcription factor [Lachnospiraceae bacterium]|nr:response regulator transcription factor [Lachnospiraceae bacterium]